MNFKFIGITLATLLAATLIAGRALAADVDVAIVFAVAVSTSIDPFAADLQSDGHASWIHRRWSLQHAFNDGPRLTPFRTWA